MQGLLGSYSLDFKTFTQTYKPVRRQNDENMGETQLMLDKRTRQLVQVKEEIVFSESDLCDIIKGLSDLIPLNSSDVFIKFLGFVIKKTPLFQKEKSTSWSVFMIYEYFPEDLEKVSTRVKQEVFFSETRLWAMIEQLTRGFILLQNLRRTFGDLRAGRVWLKGDQGFKIMFTNYHSTTLEKIKKNELFYYNSLISPEELEYVFQGIKITGNNEKSQIFALGLLVTQLGAFEIKERPYQISKKCINFECLYQKLDFMRSFYSSALCDFVFSMLSPNPALRPSFSEILKNRTFPKSERRKNESFSTPQKTIQNHRFRAKKIKLKPSNTSFDSAFLTPSIQNQIFSEEKILNEDKSTKRSEKTTVSFHSKEIIHGGHTNKLAFFDKLKKKQSPDKPQISQSTAKKPQLKKNPLTQSQTSSKSKNDIEKILQNIRLLEKQLILDPSTGLLKSNIVKKVYPDGSVFFGTLKNGKREGKGIYYFSHYEIYGGEWLNDTFHGKGVYLYDNGDRYEGDLVSGGKHGKGIYYYRNGDKYDGDWQYNMKHGFGVFYYYNNNERFEGFWSKNEKNGKGVYYFSSGDKFEGFWTNGKKNGKGTVFFADRSIFEGNWIDNIPTGSGVLKYYNGDVYQGNFLGGVKEGEGIYKHAIGDEYNGDWKVDERNGKGVNIFANGDKYVGTVFNGDRVGHGEYRYATGELYIGEWNDNLRHGKGKLILNEKSYYDGEWREGKREGFGVMVYENGDKYEGTWKADKKEGKGFYQWANGTFFKGEWKDDNINGEGIYLDESGLEISGIWNENELCD